MAQSFDSIIGDFADSVTAQWSSAWDQFKADLVRWAITLTTFSYEDFVVFIFSPLQFGAWFFINRFFGLLDVFQSLFSRITGAPIAAFVSAAITALPMTDIYEESKTRVMRGDEAVKAGLVMIGQMFATAAQSTQPLEVQIGLRVKAFVSNVSLIDRLLSFNFTAIIVNRVKTAIKTFVLSIFNMLLRVCLALASVALLLALRDNLSVGTPDYYSKRFLGQTKARVRETIRVQSRVPHNP